MGFPRKVNRTQGYARTGTVASANPIVYLAGRPVAGKDGLVAGRFAWLDNVSPSNDIYTTEKYSNKQVVANSLPVGIVSAESLQTFLDTREEAFMSLPAGSPAHIFVEADLYVATPVNVSLEHVVYANLKTGELTFDTPEANVKGYIKTSWKPLTIGSAGDIVIITNRG